MVTYQNPHGPSCPWYDLTEVAGAPNIKWCEETLCQIVTEPANTWSNLGYLIVALIIMYLGKKHKHPSYLRQFGPIVFFMGAMSFFFHMSNFYPGQVSDYVGMFLFLGWAIGMNLIRLGHLSHKKLLIFNLSLASLFTLLMHIMYIYALKFQGIVLFTGFIIMGAEIMAHMRERVSQKWFFATIIILIIAFGFSVADGKRIWCDPTQHGWFAQGHAIWHWLGSIAMFTLYLHYSQPRLLKKKL